MAVKNYMINDKWLDIAKQNIVEVESTDGVIGSVKVNGEEYGGGGGSSDFSTAEVTVNNTTGNNIQGIKVQVYDTPTSGVVPSNTYQVGSRSYIVPLYKGACFWYFTESANVSVSGDIEWDSEEQEVRISGNGTITIS